MSPTIEDLKALQDCLDKANVPLEGRTVHYMDEYGQIHIVTPKEAEDHFRKYNLV